VKKHPRIPKLVIGSNQALMALVNRSPKHLEDSLPEVDVRSAESVADKLGLDVAQRAALADRVNDWMAADSYANMRKAMINDLRGMFPDDAQRRQAVGRRAAKLWSITRADAIHRPFKLHKAFGGAMPRAKKPGAGGVYARTGRIGAGGAPRKPAVAGAAVGGRKTAAVGEIREWQGKKYQKKGPGQWVPVTGPAKAKSPEPAAKRRPKMTIKRSPEAQARMEVKAKKFEAETAATRAKLAEGKKKGKGAIKRSPAAEAKMAEKMKEFEAETAATRKKLGIEAGKTPKEGGEQLKAAIGQMAQQHGKEVVSAALNDVHVQVAEHIDHAFSTAAGGLGSEPSVQKVVKKKAGKDVHNWQSPEKVKEMAGHLGEDPQVRLMAEREVKKAMPEVIDTAAEAVANATDSEHPEHEETPEKKSKIKSIAKRILKSGSGSLAIGFIDKFLHYLAGSGIDDAAVARGFSASATANLGNVASDEAGKSGKGLVNRLITKFGGGEKAEKKEAQGTKVAGVYAGALAGMVPMMFGSGLGKSMDEMPGEPLVKAVGNPVDSVDNWALEAVLVEPVNFADVLLGDLSKASKTGVRIEMEHADTIRRIKGNPKLTIRAVAKMIADDHEAELPDYYDRLIKMEVKAKYKGKGAPSEKDVVEFLKKNQNPPDDQVHAWAERNGWEVDATEAAIYKLASEHVRLHKSMVLLKGAGHKYVKRTPTGKPKPKYRYYYKVPGRKGLVASDDIKKGAKLKMEHDGKEGHFEIKGRHKKTGKVKLEHDESGKTIHVHENDLQRMVQAHHIKRGAKTVQVSKEGEPEVPKLKLKRPEVQTTIKTPLVEKPKPEPKGKPVKLQTTDMAGLQDFDHVIGFAPDEDRAQALAKAHGEGEFGIVKQPGGFVVAARAKREAPKEGEATGEPTKLFMRDKTGKGITDMDAEYVVMDASKVIASHNPLTMAPREDYPEGVQERRYHELTGEQMKVSRISRTLEPHIVANTNPDAVNGTPIITEDGVVLGGNGRTMAMQLAYAKEPESSKKLKNHLVAHARQFGLHPDHVKEIEQPILVRRIKAGKDTGKLRALGRRMNESLTQGLDPRTAEVAMGQNYVDKNLTGVLVAGMAHDQKLSEYLHSPASRDLIKAMESSGIIDDMNRDEFVDQKTGLLNEDGRMRIERILAARMLPDASVLSNMNQKAREAIARSVPSFLRAEEAGWDIRESLMTAVKGDIDFKAGGHKSHKIYLRQVIAESDPDNPAKAVQDDKTASMLFQTLQNVGTTKTPKGFREFARRAEVAKDAGGTASLFGGDPPETMDQALDRSFGVSPEASKANREAAKATKDEEKRLAAEFGFDIEKEKRRKGPKSGDEDGGARELWAASVDSDWEKAMKDEDLPSYLMDSVVKEIKHQVHGQMQASAVQGKAFQVDGSKVKREVMDMLLHAMAADPNMAKAMGAAPLDGKAVDGLIQAFSEMHAPKMEKAIQWWSTPRETLCKAGPFIGPRGGKWADPQHKIPWKEPSAKPTKKEEPPKRKWVDKLEHLPEETHLHHKDEKGNYKPERKKLHDGIVSKFSDHVPSNKEGQRPMAVVMMGGPASGKTTAAKKLGLDLNKYVNINPDDVKEHLPEYNEAIKGSARNAAFMAHRESSEVATRVHKEALAANKNLLVDGTGKNADKYSKLVKALKKAGYHVRLVMADIDKGEAYKRMVGRAEKSGRYVPDDVFNAAHDKIPKNFHAIADHADEASLLNNSGTGPEMVWSHKGGKETVHHAEHYKTFTERNGKRKEKQA
jgi:predicted ABC-type ATPase